MKVNNCFKRKITTKLYTWEAFYNPGSGEYEERWDDEANLKKLPKKVRHMVVNLKNDLGPDIITCVFPDIFVSVYAKNVEKLERYRETMGADHIRWMLDEQFQELEGEDMLDCYVGFYNFPEPA